jgi:L-alanine-DL-glutamate epimerase-like enolase superfamily enzyme
MDAPRTGFPARRNFLRSLLAGAGGVPAARAAERAPAEVPPRIAIRRIRCYTPPRPRPLLSQSNAIVTVETEEGITGIGEGGSPDTVQALGGLLIGEDASRIEHLWQLMYRGHFYPPGREKLHALGALDLALWDIRGKALGRPLHDLLGGLTREHVECYSTAFPARGTLRETARACIEAGFRAFRISVADPGRGEPFDARAMVRKSYEQCREVREGVGPGGDWAIDYHTRLDQADAVRLSALIEELEPFFAEDLVRSEDAAVYRTLRQQVRVPIAVGEQFGDRWDINELVEQHLIDYSRVTIPNVGGITEFRKLASLCELHYVGLVPHFTGPVATAALVHVLLTAPAPVAVEILGAGPEPEPHLPHHYDFRKGKIWPNSRPGLGVEFEPALATLVAEVTEPLRPIPVYRRPDGSLTNW